MSSFYPVSSLNDAHLLSLFFERTITRDCFYIRCTHAHAFYDTAWSVGKSVIFAIKLSLINSAHVDTTKKVRDLVFRSPSYVTIFHRFFYPLFFCHITSIVLVIFPALTATFQYFRYYSGLKKMTVVRIFMFRFYFFFEGYI